MAAAGVELKVIPGKVLDGKANFQIQLKTESSGTRQPSDIVCVIDISGSMGAEATIMGAAGTAESHGLTLLDVAKHGVRTIVNVLTPNDRLAVVAFNHGATLLFGLTPMDEAGRKMAEQQLDLITHTGGTNIWAGLVQGMDALRAVSPDEHVTRFGHIMLLTDGESQDRDQIVPNMMTYKEKHERLPGTINTFGFGYNLDSALLVSMASAGSGSYSFIPDAGFVGTCFVNMTAQLLSTMATSVFLHVEKPEGAKLLPPVALGKWTVEEKDEYYRIAVGTLQFGQSKDLVLLLELTSDSTEICASAHYETSGQKKIDVGPATVKVGGGATDEVASLAVEEQWCRSKFVEALTEAVAVAKLDKSEESTKKGLQMIMQVAKAIKASPAAGTAYVQDLLQDVQGQSTEALSRHDWFWKWGQHYLPSVLFAHKLQMCNNFKDPGVQKYGGELFQTVRDEADDIFCKLPAPKSSRSSWGYSGGASAVASQAPVSMAAYNDCSAG